MKTWMVYYVDKDGMREGVEPIRAATREEAIREYRFGFGVGQELFVRAILRYDGRSTIESQSRV